MKKLFPVLAIAMIFASCKKNQPPFSGKNIDKAPHAFIDRFNSSSGTLFVRSEGTNFPAPNAPIHCDVAPFITNGLTASGAHTTYYNFDVHPT